MPTMKKLCFLLLFGGFSPVAATTSSSRKSDENFTDPTAQTATLSTMESTSALSKFSKTTIGIKPKHLRKKSKQSDSRRSMMKIRRMDVQILKANKNKSKKKGKGTPVPTLGPTPSLSIPSSSPVDTTCQPTNGSCLSTFAEMSQAFVTAVPDQVLSLCPETTISATTSIPPLTQSGISLCCLGGADCLIALQSSSLTVSGDSFRLSRIHFMGGNSGSLGGQLTITGGGHHLIENVSFEDSLSANAAVYVKTTGDLAVFNSEFINSDSIGLYVSDARKVTVDSSVFSSNFFEGMRVDWDSRGLRDLSSEGQDLEITNSIFTNNGLDGLVASNMGTLPKLSITLSFFTLNGNSGASFCCASEFESLILSGNSGFGNASPVCEDFLFNEFGDTNKSNVCLRLDSERQ